MIIGYTNVNWKNVDHPLQLGSVNESLITFNYKKPITSAPVFLGKIQVKDYLMKYSEGIHVYTLFRRDSTYGDLLQALQDESGTFFVRNGWIHGRFYLTKAGLEVKIKPLRDTKKYTAIDPYRESLLRWFEENHK